MHHVHGVEPAEVAQSGFVDEPCTRLEAGVSPQSVRRVQQARDPAKIDPVVVVAGTKRGDAASDEHQGGQASSHQRGRRIVTCPSLPPRRHDSDDEETSCHHQDKGTELRKVALHEDGRGCQQTDGQGQGKRDSLHQADDPVAQDPQGEDVARCQEAEQGAAHGQQRGDAGQPSHPQQRPE